MKTLIKTTFFKSDGHQVKLNVMTGSHKYGIYFRVLQEVDGSKTYFYPNTYEQAIKTYRQLFDFIAL